VTDGPVVLDRVTTPRGELVLRRAGEHFEVISNGTFLMDTRDGRSERLLVRAALDRHPAPRDLLIGGLGVGFSLQAAVADLRLRRIGVVEVEATVADWHRTHLAAVSSGALDDPRVQVVIADLGSWLASTTAAYDVICLDVDNGPGWTVTDGNAALYGESGIALLVSRLRPGGVLAVWSAAAVPAYERLLSRHFDLVSSHAIMVARGEPDVVVVASGPRGVRQRDGNRDRS